MSNVIDLDLLVAEPLVFKINGKSYTVPVSPDTSTTLKLMSIENKAAKKKLSSEEQIRVMEEMVLMLLSIENENVDKAFVEKLNFMQKGYIVKAWREEMDKIRQDPNL